MPTEKTFKAALRDRIEQDVPPDQFDEDNWSLIRLGDYYRDDIIKIDIVVYTITENTLHDEGRTLPDNIRKELLSAISPDTTPKGAVPLMFDAGTRAVPISERVEAISLTHGAGTEE